LPDWPHEHAGLRPPGLPALRRLRHLDAEHARAAAEIADGVIVGSRAIEVAGGGPEDLRRYVASLRTAIDSA